jgi:predicted dienelactone hydrolase
LDHSEVGAPALAPRDGETDTDRAARIDAVIASRVPDVRFLLDQMLTASWGDMTLDPARIGIVGHSFGGWTALAATEADPRIRAVVALAPGGASQRRPGILPLTLTFRWGRDVPTLYLVAENDASLPLAGMYELFARTPARKTMVILRRADHLHFMDQVAHLHEAFRTMPDAGELAAIQEEMRPMADLSSEEQAHLFVRGLTLCHMDAILRHQEEAHALLHGNIDAELARRGVEAWSTT